MISVNENNILVVNLPAEHAENLVETEQVEHEHTLYAETIWQGKYLTITNSMINAWIVVLIVIVLSLIIKLKIKKIPSGIQNGAEMVIDGALNLADSVTGNRDKTLKFFPICFALFIFVLINNWLGILPGVGSIGFNMVEEGHKVFVPLFRGGTADLNTTLALALLAVIGSNLAGAIFTGSWNYFNKFINIKAFLAIPKKILKDPTVILVNPIKAFVGIVEIIGEIAKVASLSFRLFGNIFAGEVLLASMAALVAFVVPIPFMFLEIIVGIIQALIFSVLTLVYLTIATTKEEH
ncbi:MAG: F0F1 ATP synthase subunit A [Candidatus Parcubacteria bacterium]|nr:F0F1 ATP synthase subunit A [Candidatus Parcubacteria bacterium]